MATQVSPGVVINEIDRTDALTQVALTEGAIAAPFVWGPALKVQTASSEADLVNKFGKPNNTTANAFFTAANFLSYSNTLRVVRAINASALNAVESGAGLLVKNDDHYTSNVSGLVSDRGVWAAKYPGVLGNSLRVELCGNASAFSVSPAVGTINATVVGGTTTLTFTANGYANITGNVGVGDVIVIGSQKRRITAVTNSTTFTVNTAWNTSATANAFSREWRYASLFTAAPGTSTYASARSGANDEVHIVVVDEDGEVTGTPDNVLERFEGLSKAADARAEDGSVIYYPTVINEQSAWVWWLTHPATGATNWGNNVSGVTFTSAPGTHAVSLSNGAAGEALSAAELEAGYDLFKDEQVEFSFLLGADANATVANYLISDIAAPRKYVMTFLSPSATSVINNAGDEAADIVTFRNSLTSTSYAVLDSGWKYMYDKYNQVYRYVPLNGDVAGLAARTDQLAEAWFSPAGFNRGQLRVGNTVKLAFNPTQSDRDTLYLKGVNPVVSFPGQGTVLFGDKTLQAKPGAFDRINVRRLFIVLEKTIERTAKSLLFEQNDAFTRNQFIAIVEPFLRSVQARRGIQDFFVVCDETNNPQDAIDRNEFRADIYVKPVRSINFIQLNFVAVRSDVSFNEVISNS